MKIIDAHQHFWVYDPEKHQWIDDQMPQLKKDFLPEDLRALTAPLDIFGTIAVQAEHSESETEFLLELAENNPNILGVVGWLDIRSGQLCDKLRHFSRFEKLVGLRHIVQDEADHNFLLQPKFCRGIEMLANFELTYDILVYPHQLGAVLEFVQKFPDQPFVIDHLAKPYIKDGYFEGWAALIRLIAQSENVYCKLSGLITEADWAHWKYEDLSPYLKEVYQAFGEDRLIFGSDWPVCLLAGDYADVYQVILKFTENLPRSVEEKVFSLNAINFYRVQY